MAIGEIKRIQTEVGIGYICEVGTPEELIFHAAGLVSGTFDRLRAGQKVEFDQEVFPNSPGKRRAVNIRPLPQVS